MVKIAWYPAEDESKHYKKKVKSAKTAKLRKGIAVRESRDTIRLLPQPGPAPAEVSHHALP